MAEDERPSSAVPDSPPDASSQPESDSGGTGPVYVRPPIYQILTEGAQTELVKQMESLVREEKDN